MKKRIAKWQQWQVEMRIARGNIMPQSHQNAMHKALSRIFAAESKSLESLGVGVAMQNNLKCHMKFVALLIARVKQSKRGIGNGCGTFEPPKRTLFFCLQDEQRVNPVTPQTPTPTHQIKKGRGVTKNKKGKFTSRRRNVQK